MSFIKLNDEPVLIEYVEDEHEAERDFTPSFWFENSRHYMDDYIRVHNNPWMSDTFPEHIHAMESNEYYHPLYLELVDSEHVNVYRESA